MRAGGGRATSPSRSLRPSLPGQRGARREGAHPARPGRPRGRARRPGRRRSRRRGSPRIRRRFNRRCGSPPSCSPTRVASRRLAVSSTSSSHRGRARSSTPTTRSETSSGWPTCSTGASRRAAALATATESAWSPAGRALLDDDYVTAAEIFEAGHAAAQRRRRASGRPRRSSPRAAAPRPTSICARALAFFRSVGATRWTRAGEALLAGNRVVRGRERASGLHRPREARPRRGGRRIVRVAGDRRPWSARPAHAFGDAPE